MVLKDGGDVINPETTDNPAEAKVFNSWGEADDFRSRIYLAAKSEVYPEGWGWEIEPRVILFYEFVALNDNGSEVGKWSGYPFEGGAGERDKIAEAAKKRALALLRNHPTARRVVLYEEGNKFETRYEVSYKDLKGGEQIMR